MRSGARVPSTPEGLRLLAESLVRVGSGGVGGDGQLLGGRADPRAARATGWWWSARMTPGSRRRARRPTGWTRARWRGCCGRASLSRCGCPMSAAACCAGGWRGASSSCTRARARRTRSTRCCSAGCRASRRARTCSASRAASGSPASSCPVEERESVDAGIRQIEFLDAEIAAVERLIAQQALGWPEIRRLMTVPGREPDLRRDVPRRRRRHPPVLDQPQAGRLPRPGPEGPPVRRRARAQRAGSASAARRPRAGRWSRRPGASSCSPARCTPSMSARAPAAVTARRSSRPPASSRSCSGACSPAARTTPTSSRR